MGKRSIQKKMDKILDSIKCNRCKEILKTPVILPCGHSICKVHADQADESVKCPKCGVSHQNQGFVINQDLLGVVNSQIGSMDFGPYHKEAKEACYKLEDILDQLDRIINDPIYYSHEVVDELKNKVLLKREQLKLEIDQNTEKLLVVLSDYQKKCEVKFKENNLESSFVNLNENKIATEKMLKESIDLLNQWRVDEENWRKIKQECSSKIDDISKKIESAKKLIFMDDFEKTVSQVELFVNIDLDSLFRWDAVKTNEGILDYEQMEQLRDLCKISPRTKWTLLWRGSRDGFGAEDFHSRCDNIPNTLTIIETTNGFIFGGYTDLAWNCVDNNYARDPNAYIFSLVNNVKTPFVMKIRKPEYAIYAHPFYGPIFGKGDICICNNSNKSDDSYTNIRSYLLPENLEMYPHILAGSLYFQVKKIEVFQLE